MLTLKEWGESLYRSAEPVLADRGKEILKLFDLEERDQLLSEIEEELDKTARHLGIRETDPLKIIEIIRDECDTLAECQYRMKKHGFLGENIADTCEELACTVVGIRFTLEKLGGYEITPETDLDRLVIDLCRRPRYDL